MSAITIRKIKTILTAPRGIDLVVVKVETSEPGLMAWGAPPLPSVIWQWLRRWRNT